MDRVNELIVPFAIPTADRAKIFTKDMERAAIFYLAESEREKGEGRILKKPAEDLVFIVEACYPMWLFPWRDRTLLFDGLGVMTHTLRYDKLHDVKSFHNNVKESAKTREAYSVALYHNANYFKVFAGKKEETLEGLVTNPDLIRDFVSLLQEANEVEKPIVDKTLLSCNINVSDISASIEKLSNFRAKLRKDISDLSESMKLLSVTTKGQVRLFRKEIKEIEKKFAEEIAKVKPQITERVQGIEEKCHTEIAKVSRNFDRRLQRLHKDRIRLEKKRERLNLQNERYTAEMKSCRLRGDEGGEMGWKQKLEKTKKELPLLRKELEGLNKKVEETETSKKLELAKLRSECDISIEEATKNLGELEASREAKIGLKQQEIESLKDITSTIINQINEKAGLKKGMLKELGRMGLPKSRKQYALVYLSFYVILYETENRRRFVVHPPSVVGSMGILTKLKGVFGATRIRSFLQSRSKPVTTLINQILPMIRENPVFEKEISDAGIKINILKEKKSRKLIKKGLEELKEEKWISKSELQSFGKLL